MLNLKLNHFVRVTRAYVPTVVEMPTPEVALKWANAYAPRSTGDALHVGYRSSGTGIVITHVSPEGSPEVVSVKLPPAPKETSVATVEAASPDSLRASSWWSKTHQEWFHTVHVKTAVVGFAMSCRDADPDAWRTLAGQALLKAGIKRLPCPHEVVANKRDL